MVKVEDRVADEAQAKDRVAVAAWAVADEVWAPVANASAQTAARRFRTSKACRVLKWNARSAAGR